MPYWAAGGPPGPGCQSEGQHRLIASLFRRNRDTRQIAGRAAFLDFLDSRGAFVAQKCVYEYCRARSGLNWSKLMVEPDFLAAYEVSRWEAFAAALEDLLVLFEGRLRPADPLAQPRLAESLVEAMVAVLARHPLPAHRPQGWDDRVEGLRHRLGLAQLAAPQPAAAIAKVGGARIYEALPLHSDMTKHDRELVTNAVRFNFCRIAVDLEGQLDAAALREALLARRAQATEPPVP